MRGESGHPRPADSLEVGSLGPALGVDTENPANALAIYQRLGFRLVAFEATYDKPVGQALRSG